MNQQQRRNYMIKYLLNEQAAYKAITVPNDSEGQKQLLRGLMNVRSPRTISDDFLKVQDEYLQERLQEKQIVEIESIMPMEEGIYLWQGDITRLKVGAIVNAANSGMTGCYYPNHSCIDNCIHTFSGIQLRLACAELMNQQGHEEPTGKAKITLAYNLPSEYVIHTVGPIITDKVAKRDCELLRSCYQSCLELAAENHLNSIAFCCISTGEFRFPNEKAAEIAVETVKEFMRKETSIKKVVFNVFKDKDKEIYEQLLG